jgi:hypothetical protein
MILAFGVALWLCVLLILSLVGGWKRIADQFPASVSPVDEGRHFRFVWGTVGSPSLPIVYRACLFCTVSPAGLKVSVFPLFRFMHPPMFIPWSAVDAASRDRWGLGTLTTLRLRGSSQRLRLMGDAGIAAFEAHEVHRPGIGHREPEP